MNEKIAFVEKNLEKSYEELSNFKESTNDLYMKRESDQHDTVSFY